jgi:hypothetical protein
MTVIAASYFYRIIQSSDNKMVQKMAKFELSRTPSIEFHGFFGYMWFSVELFLGTAKIKEKAVDHKL